MQVCINCLNNCLVENRVVSTKVVTRAKIILRAGPGVETQEVNDKKALFLAGAAKETQISLLSARFLEEFIQELQWKQKPRTILTTKLALKNMIKSFSE